MTTEHHSNLKELFDIMVASRCEGESRTVKTKAIALLDEGKKPAEVAEQLTNAFRKMFDWEDTLYLTIAKSGHLYYVRTMATLFMHRLERQNAIDKANRKHAEEWRDEEAAKKEAQRKERAARSENGGAPRSEIEKIIGKPALQDA